MNVKVFRGWSQVAISMVLLGVSSSTVVTAFSIVAVPLVKEFGASRMVIMLTMTVTSLVSGISAPFLGGLLDRSSVRNLMFLGASSLVAGYLTLSYVTSLSQVLLIYGLLMAPVNILIGVMAASVLISRWFVNRRGTALGIAITGVSLGGLTFPPLLQYLIEIFEWRIAFRVLALVIFLCTFPAIALVVNHPREKGLHPDGANIDPNITSAASDEPSLTAADILRDPTFWFMATIFAVVLSGMTGLVTNMVPLALDQGIQPGKAAMLISIYSGGGLLGKLSFAAVADRLNPRLLLLVALIGFGLGMLCLRWPEEGYWLIAIAVGMIGFCGGMTLPMQPLLAARVFGQRVVGRAIGLLSVVLLGASLTAPPLFGLTFDRTGRYDNAFLVFVVLTVISILLLPRIRMHLKETAPGEEYQRSILER